MGSTVSISRIPLLVFCLALWHVKSHFYEYILRSELAAFFSFIRRIASIYVIPVASHTKIFVLSGQDHRVGVTSFIVLAEPRPLD
jgi:hypothetical protein